MYRYPSIPERMVLAGLSEGEAKVKRRRIERCVTPDEPSPFKWLRMRIHAQRDAATAPVHPAANPVQATRVIVGAAPEMLNATAERVAVLCLDTRGIPVAVYVAHIGARSESMVDMRSIFMAAFMAPPTTRIIVAHNHPSGNTGMSPEDKAVFERLSEAGPVVGLRVDDFLAITPTHVSSMAARDTYEWRPRDP